ncbi:MAG: IS21-like element helper ATPase IstB [Candidatus Omnitrophica bacterium]|nr:IS21-like element helper ATPase IstB [Candidatus Omnitrophota bacterium]
MTHTLPINSRLITLLRDLHLPAFRESYEELAKTAEKESLSYPKYLLALTERESEQRQQRKIQRLLRESRLPLEKTFRSFDLKRIPVPVQCIVNNLLDGSFVDRKENILAFGNPGSGKTHLLCAIGQELIQHGRPVYFTTCSLLVQDLLIGKRNLKLARVLKRLAKYQAVVIDDIGYVQQNREEMEVLFTFLAERYERGSVMLTSNLPFSKWEQIFKDPMTTAAAIDRLVHHSIILELVDIPSYRLEQAKKKGGKPERRKEGKVTLL